MNRRSVLLTMSSSLLLTACASDLLSDDVGRVRGSGSPTIILLHGLGDGPGVWAPIIDQVSAMSTTYADKNSGADGSASEAASALQDRLKAAGLNPPYLLVGHSIGGLTALSYGITYPENVAGIVLVDGRPPRFDQACEAENLFGCKPPAIIRLTLSPAAQKQLDVAPELAKSLYDLSRIGNTPVTVMTATKTPSLAAPRFQEIWIDEQKDIVSTLPNARLVVAKGSGHYIFQEKPGLVITEIQRQIDSARRGIPVTL